jgi:predicted ATP-grasp superfamily ATP-dependent carboligase
MKLFVYEHITSGALSDQDLPQSLAREGAEMLESILKDCIELPELDVYTLYDVRLKQQLPLQTFSKITAYSVNSTEQFHHHWQHCLSLADSVLIIAPETDNLLLDLTQMAMELGIEILGCSSESIRLATNKFICEQRLKSHQIPTTNSLTLDQWSSHQLNSDTGYIIKPIDGAGCLNTYYAQTDDAVDGIIADTLPTDLSQFIIQPYLEGRSASISALIHEQDIDVLSVNEQHIKQVDTKLSLKGCTINTMIHPRLTIEEAKHLVKNVCKAIPGLEGFIGIDITVNDLQTYVIEVNPRLTTSYTGLRASLNINPLARYLELKKSGITQLPPLPPSREVHIAL